MFPYVLRCFVTVVLHSYSPSIKTRGCNRCSLFLYMPTWYCLCGHWNCHNVAVEYGCPKLKNLVLNFDSCLFILMMHIMQSFLQKQLLILWLIHNHEKSENKQTLPNMEPFMGRTFVVIYNMEVVATPSVEVYDGPVIW